MNARVTGNPQPKATGDSWYLTGGVELPIYHDTPLTGITLQALCLLVVEAGKLVTIESLIDELWDGNPPDSARAILHSSISKLRKRLGDKSREKSKQILRTAHSGYRLCIDPEQVDVLRFVNAVRSITLRGTENDDQLYKIMTDLSTAFTHLRGSLFYGIRQGIPLSRWVQLVSELHRIARGQWVEVALRLGRHREVLGELTRLSLDGPTNEEFVRWRILTLYCGGRKANALEVYAQLRTAMVAQLGIAPSPMTMDLHNKILVNDRTPTQKPQRFI